jgi:hypothetical protein
MHKFHWKALALGVALALSAVGTANVRAQNRPDDQRAQNSAPDRQDQKAAPDDHARPDEHAQPNEHAGNNDHPTDHARPEARPEERTDNDAAARYRKSHPGYAARCHDGFFTRTTDRGHACSKHGGIDVWLLL